MPAPDNSGSPQLKADPAEFALRARPRAVTRLSRRTLVIATAALTALLFALLWWALGLHAIRLNSGEELYNTDVKPGDVVPAVPGGYAALTKPKPVPPATVSAESPIPSGFGQSIPPQPGYSLPPPGPDQAEQDLERTRQQAAASAVFFTVSARQASPSTPDGGQDAGEQPTVAAFGDQRLDADTAQNFQDHKQAFLNGPVDTAIYSPQILQTPQSPYQLMAGTVIAAAMVTGLDSDLPGEVIAQVTEDVYDSVTGNTLLVPQGSRLLGKYDSIVAFGQSRILVVWTRLIMPDGRSIVLDNLPATDTQGYAGLKDGVDYHTGQLLRGIVFSTLLGVGSELATDGQTAGAGQGSIVVAVRQSGDDSATQAGQRIVSKDLAIQPTLTVRPGYPVRVLVSHDIVLKPYRG